MMLFSMTLSNIKKNFKNYGAYFLSSSFSVFVLYLFMSIIFSKTIQDQLGTKNKFMVVFYLGAQMIALFSAFFIWYSNSFFIKSRKKEFATYMLLGMSQKHVSRLNFLENIIIMILSLVTGIILGLFFTKFFIMLLFFMMKSSATIPFQWNIKALKVCIRVFIGIFVIVTIHGFVIIRKSSLLDLFNDAKKVEKGLKVSLITFVFGIAAIMLLSYGYYLAIEKLALNILKAPLVVLLVVLGTILFFTSTTSLVIHFNKKNEKKLFKGTKLISTAQLYYRYKGNVGTLSVIAITTTIALCALVTCIGSYSKAEENSRYMRPMSVEFFNNNDADTAFKNTLKSHKEVSVKKEISVELLKVKGTDPLRNSEQGYYVIGESTFDKLNSYENIDRKANMKDKDSCYLVQIQSFVADKGAIGKKVAVNTGKNNYDFNITGTDIRPNVALDHFKETLVVKDNKFEELKKNVDNINIIGMKGYFLQDDFKAESFSSDLNKNLPKESSVLTFYDHYKDGLMLLGMMAFIGLFIGLLFVTATGSVIYFKMTMEAREDKSRFVTLGKIGVSRKEIKGAVAKELLILFGAPLIVAAINAYPATIVIGKMLSLKLVSTYIIILLVYAAVYCVYYVVTLNSYMKTITE